MWFPVELYLNPPLLKTMLLAPEVLAILFSKLPIIIFEVIEPPPSPNLIPLIVRSLLNVLAPAKVCVPVVTTPRAVEDASGIFKVITGVVEVFATVEETSVPEVPNVRAATLVTVPLLGKELVDPSAIKNCELVPPGFLKDAAVIAPFVLTSVMDPLPN